MFWRRIRESAALGCLLASVGLAVIAAAAVFAPVGSTQDVITHFTPVIGAASVLVALIALLLGLRGRSLFILAAPLVLVGWIMVPEFFAAGEQAVEARAPANAPTLKLLTMNVWEANTNYAAAEALIRREQPDIIILEEARGEGWRGLVQGVADQYAHMAYCMREYWCNTIILSRLEFVEDFTPSSYYIAAARMRLPARLGGEVVEIVGVHLPWPYPVDNQRRTFPLLADMALRLNPDRAIIAGDFNSTPWSSNLRWLDRQVPFPRRTRAFFTFPSPDRGFGAFDLRAPFPLMPIDQIYAGARWKLVELRRGTRIGSDHYPVIAVFTTDAPAQTSAEQPAPTAATEPSRIIQEEAREAAPGGD